VVAGWLLGVLEWAEVLTLLGGLAHGILTWVDPNSSHVHLLLPRRRAAYWNPDSQDFDGFSGGFGGIWAFLVLLPTQANEITVHAGMAGGSGAVKKRATGGYDVTFRGKRES